MPVAMPTRATSVRVPVRVLSPKSDGLPFEHPETAAFIDPDELFSADFSPSSAVPGSGLSPSSPLVLSRCSSARGMSGHGSQSLGSPTALLPGISGSKLGMPARRESIYSRSALSSAAASWTRMSGPPPEPAPELVAEDNQGGAIMGSIMQFGRIQSQQPRVAATNGDPERAVAQPSESTNNSSTGTIDLRSKEGKATLFTNYMHMRQERALKNWQKHSIAWQTAEEKLAQGLGKVPLMSKTHLYRASVEQHHLIEEAICVLEAHYDYWLRGLRIGHDLLGLNFPLPPQGPRPLERVAWPLDARNSGPDSKLGPVPTYEDGLSRNERSYLEKRRAELEQTISALDPAGGRTHARDLAGISIIGQRISSASTARASNVDARLAATMSREIQARLSATTTASASASEKTAVTGAASQLSQLRSPSKASVKHEKTHLQLSTATIAFDTAPDQVAASCVSVYNPTDCAIRFKWVHHRPELQFGSPGAALPATNTEVVYLPVRSGILLPQSAFDFHVMFKAPRPGWYVEEWVLETTPKCCVSIVGSPDVGHGRIKISGVCTEEDSTKTARDAWALAAARSVIETMLDNVWLSAESKARGPAISAEQATYAGRNSDYQVCLFPPSSK
ncbi:MYCBP-associated protein family-domain-containing protein [Blastocladiella britannica]|nr:MYCBP-associated protein family-domain-containing protein [Blastocladiella britannica]